MTRKANRRGIGVLICIVLIGVTATVMTAVMAGMRSEAVRTRSEIDEAQASALLRAAIVVAGEQARSGHLTDGPVPTPVGDVRLTWTNANDRQATINVRLPNARREWQGSLAGITP